MATTVWQESPEVSPVGTVPSSEGAETLAQRVRSMELVRRLVTDIIDGDGRQAGSDLTEYEWAQLCHAAEAAKTEESAIAQVVVQAYALRAGHDASLPRGSSSNPDGSGGAQPFPTAPIPVQPRIQQGEPEATSTGHHQQVEPRLIPDDFCSPPGSTVIPSAVRNWFPVDAAGGVAAVTTEQTAPALRWEPDPADLPAPSLPVRPHRRSRRGQAKSAAIHFHPRSRRSVVDERRRQRLLTVTSWVRNVGAVILLFVAWQLWGTAITQHHSQALLQSQFQTKVDHKTLKPAPGFTLIPATSRIADPPQGTVMAHLQIPKIALDQFVVSGTDESDLAKGPGHYLGTAMPGQAGNVAIAGHRTTHGAPFNRLAELSIGDPVYLTAANGERTTYIVSAAPVPVSPRDVTVLNNFGDDRLTLTTCNPEFSAVQRLIVVAAYLPPGASHPSPMAKGDGKAYALAPAETSGWNMGLFPWVLLEVGALAALGLLYRRFSDAFGREGRWLILVPVWLALLLALFQTLTSFLPAAV
jgi:LPXTG-site transpeptidase (sortase) family protein